MTVSTILSPNDGLDHVQQLAALGLQPEDLTEMMWAGHVAARSVTLHEPRNAPGTSRYNRMTGALRSRLVQRGWVAEDPKGLAVVHNAEHNVNLVICSGNEHAGRPDAKGLRTRYPKGAMYQAAVRTNRQLAFGEADAEAADEGRPTWLALWHATPLEGRVEVSLPARIDDRGYVDMWQPRIILPTIAFGETAPAADDEPDNGIDIDVPMR